MADSEQAFQEARRIWREALRGHVLAPPDAGFSARLSALAAAAKQRAEACEAAYEDGFEWPAARNGAKPPYELQPGTGRRGAGELWVEREVARHRRRTAVDAVGVQDAVEDARAVARELAALISRLEPVTEPASEREIRASRGDTLFE